MKFILFYFIFCENCFQCNQLVFYIFYQVFMPFLSSFYAVSPVASDVFIKNFDVSPGVSEVFSNFFCRFPGCFGRFFQLFLTFSRLFLKFWSTIFDVSQTLNELRRDKTVFWFSPLYVNWEHLALILFTLLTKCDLNVFLNSRGLFLCIC